ncbi:MAG TPA: hypothetical protein EYO84_01130 [Planctomycetes bacterium]|nr:hypothetical protein [Planctomycetota bacterium]
MLLNELKATGDAGHTRVVAPDYATAVRILQERFGSEWTVVHSRKVRRPGFFGWFGVSDVVVIVRNEKLDNIVPVGIFESPIQLPMVSTVSTSGSVIEVGAQHRLDNSNPDRCNNLIDQLESAKTQIASELQQMCATTVVDRKLEDWERNDLPSSDFESGSDQFHEECSEDVSVDFQDEVGDVDGVIDPHFLGAVSTLLESSGIPSHAHSKIISTVCAEAIYPDLPVMELEEIAYARVGACLLERMPQTIPILPGSSGAPRIVALVGPTGVGKTTTLAKLASHFHLVEKKRVGLVTLDSYRIGAIEQLRRFTEILGLPLKTVSNLEGVKVAIDGFSDCDLILVDTAGRSQRDVERLEEVKESLSSIDDVEVHLCLSLGAAPDAVLATAESFRLVGYDRVIFTKRDESYRKGFLWDLFGFSPVPISYVTCGQEVPEDIVEATPEGIKEMILEDR